MAHLPARSFGKAKSQGHGLVMMVWKVCEYKKRLDFFEHLGRSPTKPCLCAPVCQFLNPLKIQPQRINRQHHITQPHYQCAECWV
jgi:hypothetical protein